LIVAEGGWLTGWLMSDVGQPPAMLLERPAASKQEEKSEERKREAMAINDTRRRRTQKDTGRAQPGQAKRIFGSASAFVYLFLGWLRLVGWLPDPTCLLCVLTTSLTGCVR